MDCFFATSGEVVKKRTSDTSVGISKRHMGFPRGDVDSKRTHVQVF
jgi:hypothetical protein